MNLRLRLIVAFFLLSVVPLAAVTLYTHSSNVDAVREAAGHEAELLAGELGQRMQVVTAQLSQRVERLMNLSTADDTIPAATSAAATSPTSSTGTSARPDTTAAGTTAEVARAAAAAEAGAALATRQATDTLGDLAMLINNVEIRGPGTRGRGNRGGGRGGFGGRGGPPPAQPGVPPSAPAAPVAPVPPGSPSPTASPAAVQPGAPTGTSTSAASSNGPTLSADPSAGRRGGDPNRAVDDRGSNGNGPRFRGDRSGPPPDGFQPGGPGGPGGPFPERGGGPPPDAPPDDDPTRIRIDMAPVWREVMQQFVPDGNLNSLSAEERQRVFAEVNQRMLGIQQGIQILRERVAERVADAQAQTEAARTATPSAPASPSRAVSASSPATASNPPAARAAAPAAASVQRRMTAITGSQLNVRVERDGQVVSQANAEINLPNLLATVFSTTSRERGEVPFAVGKDGKLYTPSEADRKVVEAIGSSAISPSTPAGTSVNDDWVVATTADPTGSELKFGIARPMGDAVSDLRRKTALNAGFGLGLIVLALVGIVPLSSRLTRNLDKLSEGVNRISQGDYGARVAVKSSDEIGQLARAFNQMAADVETHQRAIVGQERLRRELELGRQIQHDMLPQVPLKLGLTEIKGVSVPAREVGGDFFNYFQLTNGTVALLVGDVSGKGVGAALLMANIQASLRTRLALGQDLASLAKELDRDIESSTPGPVYATLFVGIFDPAARLLRCVNAGHNPQFVIRRDGTLERMESTGLPIGLLAGHGYTEQRVQLAPGDRLFFYTDGCVEAENITGEMFGMERLEHALSSSAHSEDALAAVEAEVTRFRAGVELSDDATMMVVKVG